MNALGQRLLVDVAERLPSVSGTQGDLEQLVLNLASNAIDAMPQGGELTVRAGQEGEHVLFEVADTGTGIDAEECARIERALAERMDFVRNERTGHGLARAAELVHLHGGELAFETRPGTGTRFWFFAKFQDARATASAAPAGMPEPAAALPTQPSAAPGLDPVAQSMTFIQDAS